MLGRQDGHAQTELGERPREGGGGRQALGRPKTRAGGPSGACRGARPWHSGLGSPSAQTRVAVHSRPTLPPSSAACLGGWAGCRQRPRGAALRAVRRRCHWPAEIFRKLTQPAATATGPQTIAKIDWYTRGHDGCTVATNGAHASAAVCQATAPDWPSRYGGASFPIRPLRQRQTNAAPPAAPRRPGDRTAGPLRRRPTASRQPQV